MGVQEVETVHPSTLYLGLPYAVIGKQEIVQKQKNVNFATHLRCLKSHTRTKNSNTPSPVRKLAFVATGKQEIVREESIVDSSTILR